MSVEQVIKELNSLNEIYEQLLDTAQIKKTVVINNDVAELTRLMTLENRLLKQIDHIEQRRAVSMSAFLKEKGIRSNLNLTITEIARLVFDPDEKKLFLRLGTLWLKMAVPSKGKRNYPAIDRTIHAVH
ncbi:flagellar export chaperone FlgN [Paenibacillus sp. JTLBN-2024]